MKRILLCLLFILIAVPCQAGWTPAERISDENTAFHPRFAVNGQYIHIIYYTFTGGNGLVHYLRSTDNGCYWDEPYLLVDTSEASGTILPVIRTNGDSVFALWSNYYHSGSRRNISFRRSLNNGLTWQPVQYLLYPRDHHFQKHTLSVSGSNVFIAYSYHDEDLIYNFMKSTNGGQTWSEPEELLRLYDADFMDMVCRGDTIFLVWAGRYSGDDRWESYYMKSNDAGDTWSDAILLSEPDTIGSHHPSISINDTGNIVVCWCDGKYSPNPWNGDLFVRYSYDMGETWTDEEQIYFNHWAAFPRVIWQGDSIHVVWQDDDIWGSIDYMLSPDNGLTWEEEQRVDNDPSDSNYPDIAVTDSNVHVVWNDFRDYYPYRGVYYSRWEPEVSIPEQLPQNYSTNLTSYPNPFNSTTMISYSNIEGGEIEIYDIRGRLVKTLVLGDSHEGPHGSSQQGQGSITWDGTDLSGEKVSTGIYFAKAGTSNNNKSLKVVYLK